MFFYALCNCVCRIFHQNRIGYADLFRHIFVAAAHQCRFGYVKHKRLAKSFYEIEKKYPWDLNKKFLLSDFGSKQNKEILSEQEIYELFKNFFS